MNNAETQATLDTRHRTKTSKIKKHNTENWKDENLKETVKPTIVDTVLTYIQTSVIRKINNKLYIKHNYECQIGIYK
jgi:hypothetical protein